jgi:hypothetical protein
MPTPPFNPEQLSTWKDATVLASKINRRNIGGGVRPQTGSPDRSGIYIPRWVSGPGGFQQPINGNNYHLHFRFANGAEGINVALALAALARYNYHPNSWAKFAEEVATNARNEAAVAALVDAA